MLLACVTHSQPGEVKPASLMQGSDGFNSIEVITRQLAKVHAAQDAGVVELEDAIHVDGCTTHGIPTRHVIDVTVLVHIDELYMRL